MDSFSTGNLRWSNTAERITSNMHATSFQIAIDRQVCIAAQGVSLISVRELDAPGPIRSRFLAPNSAAGPFRAVWRFDHTRCDSHSRRRRVEAIYHTAYRDRNGMEFQLRLPVKSRRGLAEPECLRNQHSCN